MEFKKDELKSQALSLVEKVKQDKKVAIGDYLIISEHGTFTEVDGMFRQTYYPESFTIEQACLWLAAPTLILRNYDTAEEAVEKLTAMNA